MIARKVRYLTKQKQSHDCTKSSFTDKKVMIARKVWFYLKKEKCHNCTKSKFDSLVARQRKPRHEFDPLVVVKRRVGQIHVLVFAFSGQFCATKTKQK